MLCNVRITQLREPICCVIYLGMNFVCHVPLQVERPISDKDPDVRGIRRLPGFVHLAEAAGGSPWYELVFEVEGGSATDAADAAEEQVLSYRDALSRYKPQVWAPIQIEVRPQTRSGLRSEVASKA
jgi:hypothetical protein